MRDPAEQADIERDVEEQKRTEHNDALRAVALESMNDKQTFVEVFSDLMAGDDEFVDMVNEELFKKLSSNDLSEIRDKVVTHYVEYWLHG